MSIAPDIPRTSFRSLEEDHSRRIISELENKKSHLEWEVAKLEKVAEYMKDEVLELTKKRDALIIEIFKTEETKQEKQCQEKSS